MLNNELTSLNVWGGGLKSPEDIKKKYPTCNFAFIPDFSNVNNIIKRIVISDLPSYSGKATTVNSIVPKTLNGSSTNKITVVCDAYSTYETVFYYSVFAPRNITNLVSNLTVDYSDKFLNTDTGSAVREGGILVEFSQKDQLCENEQYVNSENIVCWHIDCQLQPFDNPSGGNGGSN